MGQRHKARRLAIQFLYSSDLTGDRLEPALEKFKAAFGIPAGQSEFFHLLVTGVLENISELDTALQDQSHNWRITRMSKVDRAILRLAAFELLHFSETPKGVVINEALELAKEFSGGESRSFINGILDSLK